MRRRRDAEIMDDPALDATRHHQALKGLARINRISRSAALVAGPIAELARELGRPPRVLDIATGGGDVPAALARLGWSVDGCDCSERAVAFARERYAGVRFFRLDALREPMPGGYDVITCSLFLHHLDPDDVVRVLRSMSAAAGSLVVVNDLNRSACGLAAAWAGTRVLSTCEVVWTDGPRSVRAAYTPGEALAMAEQAGMRGATVRRRFPFRWVMTWRR